MPVLTLGGTAFRGPLFTELPRARFCEAGLFLNAAFLITAYRFFCAAATRALPSGDIDRLGELVSAVLLTLASVLALGRLGPLLGGSSREVCSESKDPL